MDEGWNIRGVEAVPRLQRYRPRSEPKRLQHVSRPVVGTAPAHEKRLGAQGVHAR